MKFFVAKVNIQEGHSATRNGVVRAVAAALRLRLRRAAPAGAARPAQRQRQAGSDRLHPAPEEALRGGQLSQRLHPHQPRGRRRGAQELRRVLRRALRRDAGARQRTRPWSPSTRGRPRRAIPAPRRRCSRPIWRRWAPTSPRRKISSMQGGARRLLRQLRQLGADAPAHALRQGHALRGFDLPRGQADGRRPRQLGRHLRRRRRAGSRATNNFQGRYIIRHYWSGPVKCDNPRYGEWGGPPDGSEPQPTAAQGLAHGAARQGRSAKKSVRLAGAARWASPGKPPHRRPSDARLNGSIARFCCSWRDRRTAFCGFFVAGSEREAHQQRLAGGAAAQGHIAR